MSEMKPYQKAIFLISLTLMISGIVSATYLVNSNDWADVYYASYNSYSDNQTPYYVRSNNLGVFNVLPTGEEVNIVESSDEPVVSNLESQVRAQGYQVGSTTSVENSLELVSDNPEKVVVVPQSYPSASLVAAPYARQIGGEVVIVNNENVGEVESIVQSASEAVMIGDFTRETSDALDDDVDEKITSPSKFNLSVKVAEKFLEEKDSSRVLVVSGNSISREVMEGSTPVLISGTNYLPENLRKFLLEDPDHNISTAVMVGAEMTTVGEEIRDYNITRNGEETNEKVGVFVKYGQARGDSESIYAISLYPLPTGDVSLSIKSTRYNPESDEVLITYRNDGDSRLYQLTSFEVLNSDGEVIGTGGDEEPVFIGQNAERTVSYSLDMNTTVDNAEVEFTTTYGSSPSQLDTYLTEEGQFSPPLRKSLTLTDIEDNSKINITSTKYLKGLDRFKVEVENTGNVDGYAQVRLTDVEVSGQERSFASERKPVPAGSKGEFFISAELDRIDLEQNQQINTVLSYGENEDTLVNSMNVERELQVSERVVKPWMLAGAAVIVVLLGAVLAVRRLDIQVEIGGDEE
jgi:hypothetical protein